MKSCRAPTAPWKAACRYVTGIYACLLRVACRDNAELMRLVEAPRREAGVQDAHSRTMLKRIAVGTPRPARR